MTVLYIGLGCVLFGLILAVMSACGWWLDETDQEYEDRLLMRHFEKMNYRRPRK